MAFKLLIIFLFESSTIFDCDVVPDVKSSIFVAFSSIFIVKRLSFSILSSFSVKYILNLRFNFSLIVLISSSFEESHITSAGVIRDIEFSISSSLCPESRGTAVVPVISRERYETIHSYELRPDYYNLFI